MIPALRIESRDKLFILEQIEEHKFLFTIQVGKELTTFRVGINELAGVRNYCSKLLDTHRRLKREREKHTGQKEIDLDR